MRLIDADALKEKFDEHYDTADMQARTRENKEHWIGVCYGVNWGRNNIADAATVDAVPVVRCEKCEYSLFIKSCSEYKCKKGYGTLKYATDFCSYGRPKDGDVR